MIVKRMWRLLFIGFFLIEKNRGNITLTSTNFRCGEPASITCAYYNLGIIDWYKGMNNKLTSCGQNSCHRPSVANYTFTAENGTSVLQMTTVLLSDDNISFKCLSNGVGPDINVTVLVAVNESSTLEIGVKNQMNVFTATSNCIKPTENLTIQWKCLHLDDTENKDCFIETISSITSQCNGSPTFCSGNGTSRKESVARLPEYTGEHYQIVKVKAIFEDGDIRIEKVSGEIKKEEPPKIQPFENCSVIVNTSKTFYCNLTAGDNSTVNYTWTLPDGSTLFTSSLQLTPVNAANEGIYSCTVQSFAGNDTRDFYLDILYPPSKPNLNMFQVDVTDGVANVLKQSDIIMTCNSTAKPNNLVYSWYPSNGHSDGQIVMENINWEGSRSYMCRVVNTMKPTCGYQQNGSNSSNVTVNIVYPPEKIEVEFNISTQVIDTSKAVRVLKGNSFTLNCSARSEPVATFKWDQQNFNSSEITIMALDRNQDHTCRASNEMHLFNDSKIQGLAYVTVQVKMLYAPVINQMQNKSIIEGSYFSYFCESTNGYPEETLYVWTGDDGSVLATEAPLIITNVTTNDIGRYTCEAWNVLVPTFGNQVNGTSFQTFSLDVLNSPTLKTIPNRSVLEGFEFIEYCEVARHGNPRESISWMFKGKVSSNSTIHLTNVSKDQSGYYNCTATNMMEPSDGAAKPGTDTQTFFLNVFYLTTVTAFDIGGQTASKTVSENDTVKMNCTVDSNPLSDIFLNATTFHGKIDIEGNQSSNTIVHNLSSVTCWDAGLYQCYGYNNYTKPPSYSQSIELHVDCTPRPLYKTKQNLTVTGALGGSLLLNMTFIAFPRPAAENFVWRKLSNTSWINVTNGSNTSITSTQLDSRLIISYLQEPDFGQYKLTVYFDRGAYNHTFFVRPQEKPQAPINFTYLEQYSTQTTAVLKWKPGFDGGLPQTFFILFKRHDDLKWNLMEVPFGRTNVTIQKLSSGTKYDIKMYSHNGMGNSPNTTTLSFLTKAETKVNDNTAIIAAAAGGGGGLAVIVICVVMIVLFIRRRGIVEKCKDSSDKPIYDDDGMEINQAYASADSLGIQPQSTSGDIYAKVDKSRMNPDTTDANTYAVVNKTKKAEKSDKGQADLYATPMKKKKDGQRKEKEKKKDKADKKNKTDKSKANEVYENAQELNVYSNDGFLKDGAEGNDYENRLEQEAPKKNLNKDGLIYADLAFNNNNRGQKKLVIHGLENATEYVQVDFTKQAEPLPASDDEGDIA